MSMFIQNISEHNFSVFFSPGSCEWNLHYFGHIRAQQTPTSFAERTEAAGPSCSLPIALVEVLQGIWRDALARDMAALVKSGFWWFIRCEEKIGKKQYEAAGNISAKGISKTAARDGGKTLRFAQRLQRFWRWQTLNPKTLSLPSVFCNPSNCIVATQHAQCWSPCKTTRSGSKISNVYSCIINYITSW